MEQAGEDVFEVARYEFAHCKNSAANVFRNLRAKVVRGDFPDMSSFTGLCYGLELDAL